MRYAPQFRDSYEVTEADLDGLVENIKSSDDDIVADAILPPTSARRFVGFAITKVSSTQVAIGEGRLWYDRGGRYYGGGAGETLDLLSVRPTFQKRIVAIVAYPDERPDDLLYRDHEIDAEAGTKVPEQVTTTIYRHARVEAAPGPEAVSPVPPVVTSALILAYVTMGTAGIEGDIRVNTDALLANLTDVEERVDELEGFRADVEPKIGSITSDLARIQKLLGEVGNRDLAYALANDVAEIKTRLDLPAAYVNYRADAYLDDRYTDRAATGTYGALTGEGLRFAPEAIAEGQLALLNPYNPDVTVTGDGLLLPKYEPIIARPVKGQTGILSLAQYTYESRTIVKSTMSRSRWRYGPDFEASTGSAFFLSGTLSPGNGVAQILTIGSETFQVLDTGKVDPDGYKVVRLSKFWVDGVAGPYWNRLVSNETIEGYAWFETFLQPQDGWLLEIDPRIWEKPASGLLHVGICETKDGQPDLTRVLAKVSAPPAEWKAYGLLGGNRKKITPTFLQAGKRYAYFLMTPSNYTVESSDAATSSPTGTMFYGLNGGVLFADPLRHIMFDLYFAKFLRNRIEIDLAPLSLSGGISTIDVTAAAVVPGSTSLTYQVQIGGIWRSLQETTGLSLLGDRPPLLPFRVVVDGNGASMPGLTLAGSRQRVSRPKTAERHVGTPINFGASVSTIRVKSRLRNFRTGTGKPHTRTITLMVGAGYVTAEPADLVTDIDRGGGVIERTSIYNLASPVTSCVPIVEATTTNAADLFVGDIDTYIGT